MVDFSHFGEAPPPAFDQLERLQHRVKRNDPFAVFEAIEVCTGSRLEMPQWLADYLMGLIADFHLGNKPSWKKKGMRPLSILRHRIEDDVRRRAVASVSAWKADKFAYTGMPRQCIKAMYNGSTKHNDLKTLEDVLDFASQGLHGLRIEEDGPFLKCSPRTLRRAYEVKTSKALPPISGSIAQLFKLNNPDSFFGLDEPLPDRFLL